MTPCATQVDVLGLICSSATADKGEGVGSASAVTGSRQQRFVSRKVRVCLLIHLLVMSEVQSGSKFDRLQIEGLQSLTTAVAEVGVRRSYRNVLRWTLSGLGEARLESVKVGGRRMTSVAAVRRFFEATNAAAELRAAPPPVTTPQRRLKASEAILGAHGLGREEE